MSRYCTVNIEDEPEKVNCEINHNKTTTDHVRNFTTEVIELPNDGRVEIVASRRCGKPVISQRSEDKVMLTLGQDDVIHVAIADAVQPSEPNMLQRCGVRIPHGPVVLDLIVSGLDFVYACLLTALVAQVRSDWKYMSIMMLWFLYVILRVHTFKKQDVNTVQRKVWHFTGISFSIMFMYATIIIVFPMLTRDAFYEKTTTNPDTWNMIMPALKASVGLALLGMAARRSFHCGKILSHMDIINSVLLDNVDIFNLVQSLSLANDSDGSPLIAKGSAMEICILLACEVAFLVIALEALMPYSLMALDARNVGKTKHTISIRESKEHAIHMVYPYSLLIQNMPFLVIRLALFARYNTFQVGYITKNITSILFGSVALIRARNSLKRQEMRNRPVSFSLSGFQQRRASV